MQAWAKRLFEEKVIEATFGRNIPIVIHEAEAETAPSAGQRDRSFPTHQGVYLEYWDSRRGSREQRSGVQ